MQHLEKPSNDSKFTTQCCISKNTPELQRQLRKLGYTKSETFDENQGYIWTSGDRYYSTDNNKFSESINYGDICIPYGIYCGDSVEAFLGIAALRNDTDRYQWFFDSYGVWEIGESDLPSKHMQLNGNKATPDDILKNFKLLGC